MSLPWKDLSDNNRRQILLLLKNKEMTPRELEEISKNTTRLTLTHIRFTSNDQVKGHSEDWLFFLGELIKHCKKKREGN